MSNGSLRQRVTEQVAAQAINELVGLVMLNPEKNMVRAARAAEALVEDPFQKQLVTSLRGYLEAASIADPPPPPLVNLRRVFAATSGVTRRRLATNLIMWMRYGTPKRDRAKEAGTPGPFSLLISPTMRCNLLCVGCYASQYGRRDDLPADVLERTINEARDLGTFIVTVLGGEPFAASKILDVFDRHSDLTFQVFTNGTLITDRVAKRLSLAGNVIVVFSVDGPRGEHDRRRGQGTLARTERGMAALRAARVPFGFSTMITRQNYLSVTSDEFVDYLIDQGCLFGWHFLYMPVGDNPDLSLMPTPEQRDYLRKNGAARIRTTKPLFVMDFWNDAPYVGGCIAAREYVHVNAVGDVEPCIFTHFATDNIKTKSLAEAMGSDFFKEIRSRQPYDENLLRPCMLIDNPDVARDVMEICGAHGTHTGADSLLTSLAAGLDAYAAEHKALADAAWAETRALNTTEV